MSEVSIQEQRTKEAGETRNVLVSFLDVLDKDGSTNETLSTVTVAVSPSGPTLSAEAVTTVARKCNGVNVAAGKAITFKVAGGSNATTYTITVTVTTSGGQTIVRKITLSVAAT